MMDIRMRQITPTTMPLPLFKPTAQSVLTSVGVPLTVQVVLSILKPAGSAGATVQLAIVLPELLKVMSVMVERAPAGSGYTKIYSTDSAFAVIKTDGTIAVWGASDSGLSLNISVCIREIALVYSGTPF
jgi:hypothetical protein